MTRSDAVCIGSVWESQSRTKVKIVKIAKFGKLQFINFCELGTTVERTLDRRAFLALYTALALKEPTQVRPMPKNVVITEDNVFEPLPALIVNRWC